MRRTPETLRSATWFGPTSLRSFAHRSRMRQLGVDATEHQGKPVIAILNTWSELNPCHMHLRERAEQVKRGVWQAGGFPVEFGVSTLSETYCKPTPMMYRNLLAIEAEETLRSYPADGAVLMGGCDKTTPALLMGAASAGLPAIYVPAGPMLRGNYRDQPVGSGTDMWKFWDDYRAGLIGDCELADLESGIARSPGHCMTMGTASTMTSSAEALGMTLPGAASIPAPDSAHYRMAAASGRRIVEMVWEGLTPADILTKEAFEDAVSAVLALGGSTNAVIHLVAMAGRCGVPLTLDDFDATSRRIPVLANIRPTGAYLMEDFYYAGGLPALLAQLSQVPGALHTDRVTVSGRTLGENLAEAQVWNPDVIRPPSNALSPEGGLAVLRGNLAPDGAVIKPLAADAGPAHPHRARSGLRQLRADAGTDRRPGARRHPGLGARAARRRAAGRAGHARVRHAAHPQVPAGPRDQGHGADLRRADERDQLRRLRPARRARVVGGRPAGAGPQRRPDHAERGRAGAAARRGRRRAGPPPGRLAAPAAPLQPRLRRPVQRAGHPGQRGLRLRVPGPPRQHPRPRAQPAVTRAAGSAGTPLMLAGVPTILITGAAGQIGTMLRPRLARPGRILRLLDITDLTAGPAEEVVRASITDMDAMTAASRGASAVIHLAGIATEASWEEILQLNIQGTYVAFEAARRAGVPRVIFASSNHAVGFSPRESFPVPDYAFPAPDTYYGVAKVAGEALAGLYHDRYGLDTICIRILTCSDKPPSVRALSTWLSPDDAAGCSRRA